MTLEKIILSLWYPDLKPGANQVLHKLLSQLFYLYFKPLEFFYKIIIKLRLFLYKKQIFKSYRSKLPVVIVGNITVGGSGKTPLVIALSKLLLAQGLRPAIILRGYSSNNDKKHITVVNHKTSVKQCGDEAKLIYNNTLCPVITCKQRVTAVKYLEDNNLCDIVISDDGLQHYQLDRDIEICVVDGKRKFGNNQLLPLGPLREPIERLKTVDFVLNKSIRPKGLMNLQSGQNTELSGGCVYAVSAIGNNDSFVDSLVKLGFKDFKTTQYPDHYNYTAEDINSILGDSKNILLTTEKDAVKISELAANIVNYHNIYFLKVESELTTEFTDIFLNKVSNLLNLNLKINKPSNHTEVIDTLC